MKRPTIKDVALKVGVNPSTVSRALKDHPDISERIKIEIRKAAEELRYHPNQHAANLRKQRSNIIGLIIPEISMFFFPSVISGIEEAIIKDGFQLLVLQSGNKLVNEIRNVQICCDQSVDGILISLSNQTNSFSHLEEAAEIGVPIVVFDKSLSTCNYDEILIDDEKAAEECVNYLISKGCKKISGFFGNSNLTISKNRLQGFKNALIKNNFPVNEELIVYADSIEEAHTQTKKLFNNDRPDGIFAMSDECLAGIIPALNEMYISIPNKCKVISISDGTIPKLLTPHTPYLHHSGFEVGRLAAQKLIERIKNDNEADHGRHFIGTKIVEN